MIISNYPREEFGIVIKMWPGKIYVGSYPPLDKKIIETFEITIRHHY